jgi:hypothetical protein
VREAVRKCPQSGESGTRLADSFLKKDIQALTSENPGLMNRSLNFTDGLPLTKHEIQKITIYFLSGDEKKENTVVNVDVLPFFSTPYS